jgi:hypothetical protein
MRFSLRRRLASRNFFAIQTVLLLALFLVHGVCVAADMPIWLQQYPHAQVVQQQVQQTDDYVLPVGRLRKVDGVWRAQKDLRLKGELQRITWMLPTGQTVSMAGQYYEALLASHDAQRLYACDARDCGSSNEWANGVFKVSELYGPDRNQVFRAYVIEEGVHWNYIALYLIERGNGRSYVHIDHMRVQGAAAGSYLSLLEINQYLSIRSDELKQPQSLAQKLDAVAQYLEAHPGHRVRLVGHAYGSGAVEGLQQSSLFLAQQVAAMLKKNGVDEKRIQAFGIGPLAPRGNVTNQQDRVEILVVES